MRFIRPEEVRAMLGVSRTTLWRMVRAGGFPRPVLISERRRGYLLDDVQAWAQARLGAAAARRLDVSFAEAAPADRRLPFVPRRRG